MKEKKPMIDWKYTFRMYVKWLLWPHCQKIDIELCEWYQNLRYYEDEYEFFY